MNEHQFQHFVEQYRAPIQKLIESGALEHKNATILLDFNGDGVLMGIRIQGRIYQRGK